ncbi:MAG: phosphoribosylglycinamide formyltransferase [Gammaproteobacteria bacterium]|nr:phosphoribosylglycinamide formyltransferase [Gammaproteobacteria bacterium]
MATKSIVILISGSGTNLQAIIDAVKQGRIKAKIAAVISNRADAKGLERARRADINAVVIEQNTYHNRVDYDTALISEIDKYHPDLIVLAGFMRILSDKFVHHYQHKVLNIHPSLLPEFKGLHTHRRVLESCQSIHGASVHFLSNELDSGPVVLQAEVPVMPNDTEATLAARVLQQEHIIYPMAIAWFIDGRLEVKGNHILLDKLTLHRPARWKSDRLILSNAP